MSSPRRLEEGGPWAPALALLVALTAACHQGGRGPAPVFSGETIDAPGLDVEGHRGDRGNHPPGNTLPAYAAGLAVGVDTIEADMQISADGQVFMGHDDDLHDTGCAWTGEGRAPSTRISSLASADIARFDCHAELEGVQAPPSLVAFLDAFFAEAGPEVALNLELKRPSRADADLYLEALIAYDAGCSGCFGERLILQSFEWSALRHARERYGDRLEFRAAILDKRGRYEEIAKARAYAEIWSPRHPLVDAERVEQVHALDMQIIPWTVNDEARMRALIELGVDGIITDYPDLLLRLVGRLR
ncbi:glycerophosphodiester phosphodiesterase family protein [Pseudenhygromyxa sp. WMMC2535]|uniref:glycerophosphodiester phosphodiesterase n=1 Tax=Pseudenhygromyxa sp. WMMC2535 TaxID=2712867 RepID=UPI001C3E18AE|nr:glycerophosphodiester phosphodiesterase family protein [Pseudenhygromyxa sp. WMMC2535]